MAVESHSAPKLEHAAATPSVSTLHAEVGTHLFLKFGGEMAQLKSVLHSETFTFALHDAPISLHNVSSVAGGSLELQRFWAMQVFFPKAGAV